MKLLRVVLLNVLVILALCLPSCVRPSSELPAVELKDLDGQIVDLATFQGKPVLVNFWATWCGPCRFEIPMLNELHKKYSSKGLVIVGISTDEEGASIVKPFMKEVPIDYPSYLKGNDTEEKFGGILGLPTNIFYDKSGKQVDKIIGLQPRDVFEQKIQQMLE